MGFFSDFLNKYIKPLVPNVDDLYEQWEEPYNWDWDEVYPELSDSQGQMVENYLRLSEEAMNNG